MAGLPSGGGGELSQGVGESGSKHFDNTKNLEKKNWWLIKIDHSADKIIFEISKFGLVFS